MENSSEVRVLRRTIVIGILIFIVGIVPVGLMPFPAWYKSLRCLKPGCDLKLLPQDLPCQPSIPRDNIWKQDVASSRDLSIWAEARVRVVDECRRSLQRQCLLTNALNTTSDPLFPQARTLLDAERAHFTELAQKEHRLRVGGRRLSGRILWAFVGLAVTLLATGLLLRSGRPILETHRDRLLKRWRPCCASFILIGAATTFVTGHLSGIDPSNEIWIDGDSQIVSIWMWLFSYGSMTGIFVMIAAPLTLLWLLGHRDFVPERLTPHSSDGECGVGAYVSFVHTWTILVFAFAVAPGILWVRFVSAGGESFPPNYLIPVGVGVILTTALAGRLVGNAIVLRARYRKAIEGLGGTWSEIEKTKPAPDPTIPFIGENWWKLPAALGTMLLALWKILDWTGAANVIIDTVGK